MIEIIVCFDSSKSSLYFFCGEWFSFFFLIVFFSFQCCRFIYFFPNHNENWTLKQWKNYCCSSLRSINSVLVVCIAFLEEPVFLSSTDCALLLMLRIEKILFFFSEIPLLLKIFSYKAHLTGTPRSATS